MSAWVTRTLKCRSTACACCWALRAQLTERQHPAPTWALSCKDKAMSTGAGTQPKISLPLWAQPHGATPTPLCSTQADPEVEVPEGLGLETGPGGTEAPGRWGPHREVRQPDVRTIHSSCLATCGSRISRVRSCTSGAGAPTCLLLALCPLGVHGIQLPFRAPWVSPAFMDAVLE
jgi:hypothetical protein